MYRFNAIKILASIFFTIDKLILKFIEKYKRPTIAKAIWKNNKIGELADNEAYYKTIGIKTV